MNLTHFNHAVAFLNELEETGTHTPIEDIDADISYWARRENIPATEAFQCLQLLCAMCQEFEGEPSRPFPYLH